MIMEKKVSNVNIKNRRASFDYIVTETYTAGIVLTGTEIKSIRQSKASLVDTYCTFINEELWVKNMHVAEYFYGSYNISMVLTITMRHVATASCCSSARSCVSSSRR